jgi:hypothetical protein
MTSLKSICREFENPKKSLTLVIVGESSSVRIVDCDDVVSVVLSLDDSEVLQVFDGTTLLWSSWSGVDIIDWEAEPEIVLVDDDVDQHDLIKKCDELSWVSVDTSI